jgi:hypothetical protein
MSQRALAAGAVGRPRHGAALPYTARPVTLWAHDPSKSRKLKPILVHIRRMRARSKKSDNVIWALLKLGLTHRSAGFQTSVIYSASQ